MKIIIMGYSGAGKSTLARAVGEKYGTAVLHLDTVFWAPGWRQRDIRVQREMVSSFLRAHGDWVIDGNYGNLYQEQRLRSADVIVLLLLGRVRCLWRVLKRWRNYKGRNRPDMSEGCPERLDRKFIRWVLWDGRSRKRRAHYRAIRERFPEKTVVLRTQRQIDRFLDGGWETG